MKNAINWFSIPVENYQRAKKFYETVLKINLLDVPMGDEKMAFFPTENGGVGGSLNEKSENFVPLTNDHISVYLNANNLDDSLGSVENAGGKILVIKTEISPEFGSFGVIIDSEGNKIGLHSN